MQISLKAARVNADLTQVEAAKRIGIDKKTLINWEKSKTYPNFLQIQKVCDVYGVTIDDIFLKTKSTLSRCN